ncbi:hypothetical protein [Streptomyces sp. B8F3]|uniref:hypothetical protein n=1 Tax=unclassified Streptomyces TaxID=2593676 RepID=UPI00325EB121
MGADLSQRLVPDELWELVAPLLPSFTSRPQGGGTAPVDERAVPAGGLGSGTTDDRIVANIDIAPTILDAAGIAPGTPQDGVSLLSPHRRDHLLLEWFKQGQGGRRSWASFVAKDRQYIELYDLYTDRNGTVSGSGAVTFREYYDLTNDPYQLTNLLHAATPADETLGVPALARRLDADRRS